MTSAVALQPVGLDPGYGNIKARGRLGQLNMGSFVATSTGGLGQAALGLRTPRRPLEVSADGVTYLVGDEAGAWGQLVDITEFYRLGSRHLTAAALAAIAAVAEEGSPISLAVGLPVALLRGEDADDQEAREVAMTLRGRLLGRRDLLIRDRREERRVVLEVAALRLFPQPVGAWASLVLDDDGVARRPEAYRSLVGVVDIGFNTVDLYGVQGGVLQPAMAQGAALGVRRLLEQVAPGLGAYTALYRLRQGQLALDSEAVREWAAEVAGFVRRCWGRLGLQSATTLLVGGGVLLLQEHDCLSLLRRSLRGHVVVHHDPVVANADGLYRLAARAAARERERAGREATP